MEYVNWEHNLQFTKVKRTKYFWKNLLAITKEEILGVLLAQQKQTKIDKNETWLVILMNTTEKNPAHLHLHHI